jgi:hypothetical protein
MLSLLLLRDRNHITIVADDAAGHGPRKTAQHFRYSSEKSTRISQRGSTKPSRRKSSLPRATGSPTSISEILAATRSRLSHPRFSTPLSIQAQLGFGGHTSDQNAPRPVRKHSIDFNNSLLDFDKCDLNNAQQPVRKHSINFDTDLCSLIKCDMDRVIVSQKERR